MTRPARHGGRFWSGPLSAMILAFGANSKEPHIGLDPVPAADRSDQTSPVVPSLRALGGDESAAVTIVSTWSHHLHMQLTPVP